MECALNIVLVLTARKAGPLIYLMSLAFLGFTQAWLGHSEDVSQRSKPPALT